MDPSGEMNYRMVDTNAEGGIGGLISGDSAHNSATVYVQVEDPQNFLDRAEELGGKTVMPLFEVPGVVKMAVFFDLGENAIGMVEGWSAAIRRRIHRKENIE